MGKKADKLKVQLLDSLQVSCTLIDSLRIAVQHIEGLEGKYKALQQLANELKQTNTVLEKLCNTFQEDIQVLEKQIRELKYDLSVSVQEELSLNKSFDELLGKYNDSVDQMKNKVT